MCNNEVDDNNVDARRSDEGMLMQDEVMKFILMIMNRGLKWTMMNRRLDDGQNGGNNDDGDLRALFKLGFGSYGRRWDLRR